MTRVFHPALSGPEQSRYQITDVASVSRSGLCINESPIRDRCGRTMGDLRLSVIDQCNLRCRYCMPEAEYAWLPRADLLSVDEISLIVDAFIAVGVDKIRLTGGEPLIRSDLAAIIEVISAKVGDGSGLQDLAITTNGVLLADQARKLKSAGMRRITIVLIRCGRTGSKQSASAGPTIKLSKALRRLRRRASPIRSLIPW